MSGRDPDAPPDAIPTRSPDADPGHDPEATMAKIPTRDEYRTRWAALDRSDRRAVVRAVNRGQRLDDRAHAALAVRLARNQKAFWARAWLLGPLAALFSVGEGLQVYLTNAVLAAVVLAGMSILWYRRADRAERGNLARVTGTPEDEIVTERVRPLGDLLDRLPLPMSLRRRRARSEDDGPATTGDDEDRPQIPGVDFPTEPVKGRGHTPRSKRKR